MLLEKGGNGGGQDNGNNGKGNDDKSNNGSEKERREKSAEKEKELNGKGYKGKGKHLGWYKNGKYGLGELNPELIDTTYYLNDTASPLSQVLMTYDVHDRYRAAYVYGLERIEVQAADDTRPESQDPLYYLYDGLGSVKQLVRPNGEVRDRYRYDEFGVPDPGAKLSEDGRNVNHNPFGYTGELWDEENDLLYLRSRYYRPEMGRFLTRDVFPGFAANPLSMHKYAYVENNPVNYVDSLGHAKAGDEKFSAAVRAQIAVWGEAWTLTQKAYEQGLITLDDKQFVQKIFEGAADQIRALARKNIVNTEILDVLTKTIKPSMIGQRISVSAAFFVGVTKSVDYLTDFNGNAYTFSSNEESLGFQVSAGVAPTPIFVWGTKASDDYLGPYIGFNASGKYGTGVSFSYSRSKCKNSNGQYTRTIAFGLSFGGGGGVSGLTGYTVEGYGALWTSLEDYY